MRYVEFKPGPVADFIIEAFVLVGFLRFFLMALLALCCMLCDLSQRYREEQCDAPGLGQ